MMRGGRTSARRLRETLRKLLMVVLAGLMALSIFEIFSINGHYAHEEEIRQQMELYRPEPGRISLVEEEIVNQNVLDAQEMNGDIVGWLTMEGTRIDYPFVQTGDNDYYLRRDINGSFAYAGTIFMDYRCAMDLSDFATVLYGHNMKNGSMFFDLQRYDDASFFAQASPGWLYLPNATYRVEPFAYLLVRSDDSGIYAFHLDSEGQKEQMLAYIREKALRYRELSLTINDKLLILSTCAYDFKKARSVVVARLVAMPGSKQTSLSSLPDFSGTAQSG